MYGKNKSDVIWFGGGGVTLDVIFLFFGIDRAKDKFAMKFLTGRVLAHAD